MYRSILVPLDGSAFGEQALPLALSLARRAGASVEVAHVHETLAPIFSHPIAGMAATFDNEIRVQQTAYVNSVVKRLKSQSKVHIVPAFLEGAVAPAILDHVSGKKTDLLVMTTHGRGPLARFWLGSVADELVRHAPVPILLVHPQEEKSDLASQSKEPLFRKALVAVDGTQLSESILDKAVSLASSMQAELLLVRVIEPMVVGNLTIPEPNTGSVAPSVIDKLEAWHEQRLQEATAYLEKLAGTLRSKSLTVRASVVSHDQPAVAILNEARNQGADVIAIETHGRSGLARFALGSVADKVIRGATIPVLVHHQDESQVLAQEAS